MKTIPFDDFMKGNTAERKKTAHKSLSVLPVMLFDPVTFIIGGAVASLFIAEGVAKHTGNYDVAEKLHLFGGIGVTIVTYSFIYYLVVNNPLMGAF